MNDLVAQAKQLFATPLFALRIYQGYFFGHLLRKIPKTELLINIEVHDLDLLVN